MRCEHETETVAAPHPPVPALRTHFHTLTHGKDLSCGLPATDRYQIGAAVPPRLFVYGTRRRRQNEPCRLAPRTSSSCDLERGLGAIVCPHIPLELLSGDHRRTESRSCQEPHDYQTVVIDSADWLERLIWDELCKAYGVSSIEKVDGGYGKGYVHALTYWREVIDLLTKLRDRAEHDGHHAGPRQGRALRGSGRARPTTATRPGSTSTPLRLVCEWSDAVLFATSRMVTRTETGAFNRTRTKAQPVGKDGGERILRCIGGPSLHRQESLRPARRTPARLGRPGGGPVPATEHQHFSTSSTRSLTQWQIYVVLTRTRWSRATPFEAIPAGKYLAMITASEMKPNKAGTGRFLELCFTIVEGEYRNRNVWARLNLENPNELAMKIAQAELSALCRAVGVLTPNDSVELHNLPLVITRQVQEAEGHRRDHQRDRRLREAGGHHRQAAAGADQHAAVEEAVMGAKSRRKGCRGELEAAAELHRLFGVEAHRGRQYCGC